MVVVVVIVVVVEAMMVWGMGRLGVVDVVITTSVQSMDWMGWNSHTLKESDGSVASSDTRLGWMGVVVVLMVMVLLVVVVVVVA